MFNCRSPTRAAFKGLNRNPFIWVATAIVMALQLIAIYVAPIARVLNTTRLAPIDWLIAGGAVIAPILFCRSNEVYCSLQGGQQVRVPAPEFHQGSPS